MLEIIYDMKLVFVLVDALKSLYLTEENMPFLYNLSKKGPGTLSKLFQAQDFAKEAKFSRGWIVMIQVTLQL